MNKEYLVYKLADKVRATTRIDSALFQRYGVKRGLRNEDGSGVLVGLTTSATWLVTSGRRTAVSNLWTAGCTTVVMN